MAFTDPNRMIFSVSEAEPIGTCRWMRDYCLEKCARAPESRPWPRRADIDPFELRQYLPHLCIWDVIGNPPRFRCRLVGTKIVEMDGVDATGKWSDESINPLFRELFLGHYLRVITEHIWLCHNISFIGRDDRPYSYQRLLMPMGEPGEPPSMMFGVIHFGV